MVTGFVRPFTEEQARAYVSGGEELAKWQMSVTRVWAVAEFSSGELATAAVARMDAQHWPAKNTGSTLKARVATSFEEGLRMVVVAEKETDEKAKSEPAEERPAKAAKRSEDSSRLLDVKPVSKTFRQTETKPVLCFSIKD